METGIRKTLEGYKVWFKIGNQTFHLDEHVEDTDEDSFEAAQFLERMLIVAFEKLDIHVDSKGQSEQLVCPKCRSGCNPNETGNRWQKCGCCGNEWAN